MSSWAGIVATTGIILGAAYMLWLYWRICFGTQRNADAAAMPDLSMREWWLLGPIALAVLWMGVYPESFIAPMRQEVAALDARLAQARWVGDVQSDTTRAPRAALESVAARFADLFLAP